MTGSPSLGDRHTAYGKLLMRLSKTKATPSGSPMCNQSVKTLLVDYVSRDVVRGWYAYPCVFTKGDIITLRSNEGWDSYLINCKEHRLAGVGSYEVVLYVSSVEGV